MKFPQRASLVLFSVLFSAAALYGEVGIPVTIHLEQPGFVTVVAEDAHEVRVRNLLAETWLGAGDNTVVWDGYDDGERTEAGLIRRRVSPGTYRFRGLTHAGIGMAFQMTVYNPGVPPWQTKDGSGGWLADHSPPSDILRLARPTPAPNGNENARYLVCSTSAEAGNEFVWLDDEGKRLFGTNDGFWGGTHLARDVGPNPAPGCYAFVFENGQRDGDNFNIEVRGFRQSDGQLERVVNYPRPRTLRSFTGKEADGSDGLAVYNGRLVMAVTMLNKLVIADVQSKKITGEIAIDAPRSPAFDASGHLFVLSGNKLLSFDHAPAKEPFPAPETMAKELDDPRRVTLDDSGSIYISLWGKSHQVLVCGSDGKQRRRVGLPGGPQTGIYDERRMAFPAGMTVDPDGRVWVAEADTPKRISLWSPQGEFVKAFYGPMKYGGGGAIDPTDASRFYYDELGNGIEFHLDWDRSVASVRSIYCRKADSPDAMPASEAPERALHVGGHQYMVNCYNGDLRYNRDRGVGIWRMDSDGVARAVAIIGNGADLTNSIWGWPMKHRDEIVRLWSGQNPSNVLFVWCDRNGDGVAQPDEIQWIAEDHSAAPDSGIGGPGLEPLVFDDLSAATAFGIVIPAPRIDERGIPIYDLKQVKHIGKTDVLRSPLIAGERIVTHGDRSNSWLGFDLQGKRSWQYLSTPEEEVGGPGAMVSPTRLLGLPVTPHAGDAGPVIAVNGEMGAIYLLTVDGLFIQTLGGDARVFPPLSGPAPVKNAMIHDISFQQEHFHPTLNQTPNGNVYLVAGFQEGLILRLNGLDGIRRSEFGKATLTDQQLAVIPPTSLRAARKQRRPRLTVPLLSRAPSMAGNFASWPVDSWAQIDESASAAVAADDKNLYVAFRTGDPGALQNGGNDFHYLFKTGGALDLMLGTDGSAPADRTSPSPGDLRITVARTPRGLTAAVFKPISPNAPEPEHVLYQSPIGKVNFDEVRAISDRITLISEQGNFQIAIPLDAIHFRPVAGTDILADIGILRGSEGRTMRRSYWSNANSTLVSDIPSEARLQPEYWGIWHFETNK